MLWRGMWLVPFVAVVVLALLLVSGAVPAMTAGRPGTISGRVLESCSCMVPCPCNFGQAPSPRDYCDSLAVFEFERGEIDRIELRGLRFAIAGRAGRVATVYLNPDLSDSQRKALRKIATWILSLEGTPLLAVIAAPVNLGSGAEEERAAVGTQSELRIRLVKGNDRSVIAVSHPFMFGSFPIKSARKGVSTTLRVRSPGLSFEYHGTNANDATFEFLATDVR